jgi:hypothetical protein
MKIQAYRLSAPYPFVKLVRDGRDIVFSFMSFYIRIGG